MELVDGKAPKKPTQFGDPDVHLPPKGTAPVTLRTRNIDNLEGIKATTAVRNFQPPSEPFISSSLQVTETIDLLSSGIAAICRGQATYDAEITHRSLRSSYLESNEANSSITLQVTVDPQESPGEVF